MARLLSVNVGLPRELQWQGKTVRTAIWKSPVQGLRMVRKLNQAMKELARPATIYAIHLKARFRAEIIKELKALRLADLKIAQFGRPYSF